MTATFAREKLIEAMTFFATNVKNPGWVKVLKLVYYLDLIHLRRTGRTVTGLTYSAWPFGPVPEGLYAEIKNPASDLHKHFEISASKVESDEYVTPTMDSNESDVGKDPMKRRLAGSFKPKRAFQQHYLSQRELRIARDLAEIFYDVRAQDISDVSHQKFGPWQKALWRAKKEGKERPPIDLLEGIVACGDHKLELPLDQLRELIAEREENERALG